MGIFCKPARILRFVFLTAIAFAIFAFLNLFIDPPPQDFNDELETVNKLPRNHLEFAQWEVNQHGPGEQGAGVILEGKEKELGDESFKKWFMNLYASDKISLDRSLKDQRSAACRIQNYDFDLPSASVIIVFTDEAWTPLLRTGKIFKIFKLKSDKRENC